MSSETQYAVTNLFASARMITGAETQVAVRPAGQVETVVDPVPAPEPVPTTPPAITLQPNGQLSGIDAVLDQVFGAMGRQIGPMITGEVLPVIQQDKELQKTVGTAVGTAIWEGARPWVILMAAALTVVASVQVDRVVRRRKKGKRSGA